MKVEICGTVQIVPDGTDVSDKPWCKVVEEPQSKIIEESKKTIEIRSGDKIKDVSSDNDIYMAVEFYLDQDKYIMFVSLTYHGVRLTAPYIMKNKKHTTLEELYSNLVSDWEFEVITS